MFNKLRKSEFGKKISTILIVSFLMQNATYSTNIDTKDINVEMTATESNMAATYQKSIENAILSAFETPVYNLPSPFTQPEFNPYPTDFFGENEDRVPIFSVDLSSDKTKPQNIISFTFDSAYINKYTYDILDILDEYDAKATFFMTYEYMSKNPQQIKDIIKRGHEIGNHSTSHPDFNLEPDAKVVYEVCKAQSFLQNLCGVKMSLFRFPFGSYSPRTVTILKTLGYYPIQWGKDSIDWKNEGVRQIVNRIATPSALRPGNIILFHNGADFTPEALPIIFEKVNEYNLKVVRVSDLIFKHEFAIAPGSGRQYYCGKDNDEIENIEDTEDVELESMSIDEEIKF